MGSLYLRLLSASNLGMTRMKIKDLRPGALWQGCDDTEIEIPSEANLKFVFLGAKIEKDSSVIYRGSDGLGERLEMKPGTVAITMANQPGWDGFAFLVGWTKKLQVQILFANQTKHRDSNLGNGEASETKLMNGKFKSIVQKQMKPVFHHLLDMFEDDLATEVEIVFDVFTDRFDPIRPKTGLNELSEKYCLTRDSTIDIVTGTPLAQTINRMKINSG
jgi:hypothetical protein